MSVLANWTLEQFDPAWFWVSLALVSVGVLALTYAGIYRRSGRRLTWTLLAMRIIGVLALLAALVKPAYEHVQERTERPAVAVIVDDSQSMSLSHPPSLDDAERGGAWQPRYELARRWLDDSPHGRALARRYDVRLFDIAGRPLPDNALPDQPLAEQTDLTRALRSVATQMRGRHTAGVILISDGQDTSGRRGFEALETYPLAIHALGFTPPPRDADAPVRVEVRDVEAPSRVLAHHETEVRVLLAKDGGPMADVPVRIERGGELVAQTLAPLPEGRVERMVSVPLTAEEPGDFVMRVRVGDDGDALEPTAGRLFRLRVDAEPVRVLYVEGVLRSEARFLRERLRDDPDVELVSFVRAGRPGAADARALTRELFDPDRLERIDVVLLGDFEPAMLEPEVYARLRKWVDEGGGLMVLGGYSNLTSGGLGETDLAEVLPVALADGYAEQVEQPLRFETTASGAAHPVLRLTGDARRDAERWARLPELAGVVATGPPRAGADVLVRHHAVNPADPDERGYIVLAAQPFGQGLVMVMTADTTWRWSRVARLRGEPDTLYVRFWSQAMRYLAQREDEHDRPPLSVSTNRVSYERGERIDVRVHRNPAVDVPADGGAADGELTVQVRRPDGRTIALEPRPDTAEPNVWRAHYFPDQGGAYQLEAGWRGAGDGDGVPAASEVSEFVVAGSELELANPVPNPATLRQIARLTGGSYSAIDGEDAGELAMNLMSDEPRVRRETRKAHYWNSPVLFVLFLAAISAEWFIRRWNKLV